MKILNFVEIVQAAKRIVDIIDKNDDNVIQVLVALQRFLPEPYNTFIGVLVDSEKTTVSMLLAIMGKVEESKDKGAKKLEKALEEAGKVKIEKDTAKNYINELVSIFNTIIGK